MLHAKTLCLDGAWSCVGSANFDNRSFQLNDEATLVRQQPRRSPPTSTAQFARDLEVSEAMSPARWRRRPLRRRATEAVAGVARREL